jgi:hypothetical protein
MQHGRLLSDWRLRQGWIGLDVTRAFCRQGGSGGRCVTARMRPGELSRAPEASVMRGCGGDVWILAMPIADHCLVRVTTVFVPSSAARRRLPCCAQPTGEAVSGAAAHTASLCVYVCGAVPCESRDAGTSGRSHGCVATFPFSRGNISLPCLDT